ncbi:amino acid permease [Phenylobacterium sp.]|jgi:APA family basic amino acid/polyamine antiporter|uniref:amino acid permease n=1 Tax=Phenylobacterium sp. TaxID=1871053 RepID=UPI002E3452EB|nr:amino acid permease [Phenylobacterium sp.]HEX2560456.1 amino acid permease [Phenylobacterium sp.]
MKLFTKKPIDVLLAQATEEGEHTLKRGLGPVSLTALGVGGIIGAGIFVLTGQQAAVNAGPAIILSFVLAGVVCAFAALCYAELASMIPVAGSAYTYTYATLGEFFAWIIAWDLILEYGIAAATVAAGWSGYFGNMMEGFGLGLPEVWSSAPYAFEAGAGIVRTGAILNLPAMAIIGLMAAALIAGIGHSAFVNNIIVALKVLVVVTVIAFGLFYIDPANWQPFIPERVPPTPQDPQGHFGWPGIAAAAGVIFFAYIGFEGVSTAAQEAKDPQRTMPIGILGSLAICTVLYMLMAAVITGIADFRTLNNPAPVASALQAIPELTWLRQLVNIGVAVGLGSTILALMYGQSRIFYAMARDGLLPPIFGKVNPKTRTPAAGTIVIAVGAAIAAGLLPIGILGELVSMGTLLAFGLICAGVLYLRIKHPELPRTFKTPLVWVTAPLGILGCAYLIFSLPPETWTRLWLWMGAGLIIYFGYAYWHSRHHEKKLAAAE